MQERWFQSLGQDDTLEKEMATHSGILSWESPWTEESGGLQSVGFQRVGHNWMTEHTHTHWNLIGIVALIWPKENLLFIWLMQKKKVSLAIARYKYATCPHLSPWLYKLRGSWTLSINLQLKMSALLSYFQDIIEICPILSISMTITPTRVTVSLSPRPLQ